MTTEGFGNAGASLKAGHAAHPRCYVAHAPITGSCSGFRMVNLDFAPCLFHR
jgi:hypothetical protein